MNEEIIGTLDEAPTPEPGNAVQFGPPGMPPAVHVTAPPPVMPRPKRRARLGAADEEHGCKLGAVKLGGA